MRLLTVGVKNPSESSRLRRGLLTQLIIMKKQMEDVLQPLYITMCYFSVYASLPLHAFWFALSYCILL